MNKISGYGTFKVEGGGDIEMKFSNGAYQLYAESMGLTNMEDVTRSLTPQLDSEGKPITTIALLTAFRRFVCAGIVYAARAQAKPVPFTDEMQVQEWIDAIGMDQIMAVVDPSADIPSADDSAKKKGKNQAPAATPA